jgi:hypothetical protein
MQRAFLLVITALLMIAARTDAKLVPIPFMTQPSIQRLTKDEAVEHWSYDFFGQCHGFAVAPLPRLGTEDSVPLAMVASDPLRNRVVFGLCFEKGENRGYEWFDIDSPRKPNGSMSLALPLGVAIDTIPYEANASYVYVYVANAASASVPRFRLDLANRTLSYVDDLYATTSGTISDVSCASAPDSGECYRIKPMLKVLKVPIDKKAVSPSNSSA